MVVEGDYIVVPNGVGDNHGEGEATFDMIAATVTTLALECKTGLILCEIRTCFLQRPETCVFRCSSTVVHNIILVIYYSYIRVLRGAPVFGSRGTVLS